eukprot:CAMPEP_0171170180 /NCGR_PEP_ID=MMETSP0790-20130122/8584_1 /TAXON_ID=2925 /ORGANISM="Alexandrium catenella, Strain OF101" /LENGTH=445 /DNA_ID=CAMNT_0011635025 /DNA_START=95 /DNA_END=1432 /DNA_ORIENTATION=+
MVCCGANKRMQEQEQPQRPQIAKPDASQVQRTEHEEPQQAQLQEQQQEQPQQQEQQQQQGQEHAKHKHTHFSESFGHLPTLRASGHARQGDEPAESKKDCGDIEKKASGASSWSGMLSWNGKSSSSLPEAHAEAGAAAASEGNILGALVQRMVAGFDEGLLGVKVQTESLKLEPISGVVEVHGLKVGNPHGFRSAHLLRANKVVLRVNMARLVTSLGGVVEVDEVELDDVDVIYEKALRSSNLSTLLHHLEGDDGKGGHGAKHQHGNHQHGGHGHHEEGHQPQVALHKISVRNVGAKVCSSLSVTVGPRLAVGDIHYEDFDKTSGGGKGLMQVVSLVLATLIKSILASLLGERASDGVARAASGASAGVAGTFFHALHKSKTAVSHVHMPFGHHSAHGEEGGEQAEAEAAKAHSPASTWFGYAAPWRCCQEVGLAREEGEITVGQ